MQSMGGTLKRSTLNMATFRAVPEVTSPTGGVPVTSATLPHRPGILKQTGSHQQMSSAPSQTFIPPRPPPDLQPTTTSFSHGLCSMPECSSKMGLDLSHGESPDGSSGDPNAGFNSNCQQCLAERAATVGAIGITTTESCGTQVSRLDDHHLDMSGGLEFTSLHSDDGIESLTNGEEARGPPIDTPEPGRTYECEGWCRETSRLVARCLGACLVAAAYAALGGVLFMAVESGEGAFDSSVLIDSVNDISDKDVIVLEPPTVMNVTAVLLDMPPEVRSNVDRARTETVTKLWQVTERMNILYPENWTRIAAEELLWFQDQLSKALTQEFHARIRTQASQHPQPRWSAAPATTDLHHGGHHEWTFARGLLYSVSILTAVGCGVDWVVSPLSRVLTVFYILIGAPIMFMYISTTGGLFARALRFAVHRITCSSSIPLKGRRQRPVVKRTDSNKDPESKPGSRRTLASSRSSCSSLTEVKCEKPASITTALSSSLSTGSKRSTWQTRGSALANQRSHGSTQYRQTVATSHRGSNGVGIMNYSDWDGRRPSIGGPIISCILILVSYVACGAAFVAEAQGWTFDEAFYFCFVTLTTIGFGGLRPSEPHLWSCAIYLFLGAAVLSTCLHIIYEDVIQRLSRYRALKVQQRYLLDNSDDSFNSVKNPELAAGSNS